ncbi:MAG: bifunctional phosphoribosylaminoimidazolecarboxamide formyltransferase/IMP cyclohydrolase [Actinomycetota bacterium]|nr:bifunctional phosphoribosylaminoimidazolecarboxamide formyltransferase/IMP cyclohydrolase [Actinomycetota bacterium]
MPKVKRALISVSDKTDVVWFSKELSGMGVEIISTGGTYKLLGQNKVKATPVAEVTGFPEMLDGRVKTLHPKIHGGILADRSKPEHMRQLDFQKIPQIDLVAVNLYPFAETISKPGVTRAEAIEQIDIGGPTLLRAAAKNYEHVAVVVNPAMYKPIVEEMRSSGGGISVETCSRLAREAFAHTAEYDSMISAYFSTEDFPRAIAFAFRKVSDLRYGENPHQRAALYREALASNSLATAARIFGPELSFNNVLDGEAAWICSLEFDEPSCVIIKHNNPCGVAVADSLAVAYQKAFECDSVSAFGSVIAFNREVDEETARELKENFVELVIAPSYEPQALSVLRTKKDMRLLETGGPSDGTRSLDFRRIRGGLLLQEYDNDPCDRSSWKVVTGVEPASEQYRDLLFAWKVCKFVKSNAIVLAKNEATVGVGAGQMSRVDSAYIAARKAGERSQGSVAASDAFFPFADAVEELVRAGVKAIIQPGGSKRDEECISVCREAGIPMVFTGMRHFRH